MDYSYTTLVVAIKTHAEDTDPDFVSEIPNIITRAEDRVLKDLDLEMFEQWLSVTISGSSRTVPKPTDVLYVNELFVRTPAGQSWFEVPRRSFEYCITYAPSETAEDVPAYFADQDESNIYVVPTPDQAYSGGNAKVRATIRPSRLTASNETTWVGKYQGDLLLHACMMEAFNYLKHPAKVQESAKVYQSLVPSISKEIEQSVKRTYKQLNNRKQGADS